MINFPIILTVIVNVLCAMTSYLFSLHNAPLISAISSIRRRTHHSLAFNIRMLESPLASFWKNPKRKSSRTTCLKLYKHGFVHIIHCLTISSVANGLKSVLFLSGHMVEVIFLFLHKYGKQILLEIFQGCQYPFLRYVQQNETSSWGKPGNNLANVLSGKNDHWFCKGGSYFLKDFKRKSQRQPLTPALKITQLHEAH